MKQLKLEVGRTYRSRKGTEVKIIGKDNQCSNPYQGSNGECYAEGGKWRYDSKEDPEDLVEEVMRTIAEDYAKAVLREQYESYVPQDNSLHWPIRAWAINEAYNDPVFFRWLFDDDTVDDFGANLSDEERKMASNFFKSL